MFLPEEAGAPSAGAESQETNRYANIEGVPGDDAVDVTPPKPKEPEPDGETEGPEDEAKRKKGGFTKKLAAKDAEIERLKAQLGEPKAPEKVAETKEAPKPQPDKFETWEAYYEALADWKVEQGVTKLVTEKLKERETQARQDALRKEAATLEAQYKAKADEFKAKQPDFDEVIDDYDGPLTPLMRQALVESEVGPQVAYYIASNPAEGERLALLGAVGLAKAIGRIEAKLEGEQPVEKAPLKVTSAPPPIKPVARASTTVNSNPYDGETDHEAYKAWRAKQKR